MDPHNKHEFASMKNMKYWNRVDWYNGGMEHTARHLLYARFWVQMLYKQGLVPHKEMIWTRVSHGMILGPDNQKMSKSKGNVINPDDIVNEYGADVLRVYEMFMGDYQMDAAWSIDSLRGCKRFLDRIIRLKDKINDNVENDSNISALRCIDWKRGRPYTFTIDDYDLLSKSKMLFARKFNSSIDEQIVRKIYSTFS